MTITLFKQMYPIGIEVRCLSQYGKIIGYATVDNMELLDILLDGAILPVRTMPADLRQLTGSEERVRNAERSIRRRYGI